MPWLRINKKIQYRPLLCKSWCGIANAPGLGREAQVVFQHCRFKGRKDEGHLKPWQELLN